MLCKIQRLKKKRRSRRDDGGIICLSHLLSAPDAGLGSESDAQRRAHLKATLGVLPEVVVQLPGKRDACRTKREKQRRRREKQGARASSKRISYPTVIQRLSNGFDMYLFLNNTPLPCARDEDSSSANAPTPKF